jgi:hypothetical protein
MTGISDSHSNALGNSFMGDVLRPQIPVGDAKFYVVFGENCLGLSQAHFLLVNQVMCHDRWLVLW